MESGGDHDVVSSVSSRFLYLEVKTAPPKHIEQPEISGFVRRIIDVAPDIAVFHNDTHLRMKDKIVPLLEEGIRTAQSRGASSFKCKIPNFKRVEREVFQLDSYVYVINSKPDLRRNLTTVFRHYFRTTNPFLENLT
jgi:hypothetical protein